MSTSRAQIEAWLREGQNKGARWVLVASDSFSYDDYPVYISADEDPRAEHDRLLGAGEKLMEAYDLELDIESQLAEYRAWHLPAR